MRQSWAGRRMLRAAALIAAVALCGSTTACGNRNSEAEVAAAAGVDHGGGGTLAVAPGQVDTSTLPVAPAEGTGAVVAPPTSAPAGGNPAVAPATQATTGAGASNGGSTKPAANQPAAPVAARVANLSPINVGFVGTFSGPVGALVSGTTTGARVWAKYQNTIGGLNGHPVNVIVADDAGDPARYNSLIKKLVEQDKVVAFLQTTLGFAPAGNNEYLNSKGIMTFSSEGGLDQFYENPYTVTAFPSGSTYAEAIISAVAALAVPAKKVKLGSIACSDFGICDLFDAKWKNAEFLKTIGLTPVFSARPSITQPDYTASCLSAKQAGVDLLVIALDSASIERFAADCARQNYRPMLGTGDIVVNSTLPNAAQVDGIVIGTKIAPWTATGVPGVQTYLNALKQYAPSQAPDGSTELGWAAGMFFAAAAKNLPASPTPADVFRGTYQIKGETLGGMTYPLDFTKSKTAPRKLCYGIVVVQDKKFAAAPGDPLRCAKS